MIPRSLMIRGLLIALPALLLAQQVVQAMPLAPDQPQLRKTPAAWVGLLLMVLLAVAVLVISMWPSKRGHQD